MAWSPEARIRKHQRRRDQAAMKQPLRPVQIGEDQVEKPSALDQPRFELAPFRRRDYQGNRVEIPGSIHSQWIAIDVVGNAVFPNTMLRRLPAACQFLVAERRQRMDEFVPMGTKNPRRCAHLVVHTGRLEITGAQQRCSRRVCGNLHSGSAGITIRTLQGTLTAPTANPESGGTPDYVLRLESR